MSLKTAQRWKHQGYAPPIGAKLLQLQITRDLGALAAPWTGFRLHQGCKSSGVHGRVDHDLNLGKLQRFQLFATIRNRSQFAGVSAMHFRASIRGLALTHLKEQACRHQSGLAS